MRRHNRRGARRDFLGAQGRSGNSGGKCSPEHRPAAAGSGDAADPAARLMRFMRRVSGGARYDVARSDQGGFADQRGRAAQGRTDVVRPPVQARAESHESDFAAVAVLSIAGGKKEAGGPASLRSFHHEAKEPYSEPSCGGNFLNMSETASAIFFSFFSGLPLTVSEARPRKMSCLFELSKTSTVR